MPTTPVMGVRSSCVTVATGATLALSGDVAVRRARREAMNPAAKAATAMAMMVSMSFLSQPDHRAAEVKERFSVDDPVEPVKLRAWAAKSMRPRQG
ncbi:hypothetical protein GCM10007276_28970 [Agaricicola taiwanensis]|uniref:Uncharacterized protein n=1 Tax=Agaricicola taiwanensis TaxID=591372 RepID=A0A8J2YL43_9RHOB|nr:hypothetical protein GCM10007276_28970 [Agaricicola taiwanensis]